MSEEKEIEKKFKVLDYGLVQYLNRREKYRTKIQRVFLYLEIQGQWTTGEMAKEYRNAENFYAQVVFDKSAI